MLASQGNWASRPIRAVLATQIFRLPLVVAFLIAEGAFTNLGRRTLKVFVALGAFEQGKPSFPVRTVLAGLPLVLAFLVTEVVPSNSRRAALKIFLTLVTSHDDPLALRFTQAFPGAEVPVLCGLAALFTFDHCRLSIIPPSYRVANDSISGWRIWNEGHPVPMPLVKSKVDQARLPCMAFHSCINFFTRAFA